MHKESNLTIPYRNYPEAIVITKPQDNHTGFIKTIKQCVSDSSAIIENKENMNNIYQNAIQAVEGGAKFKIDFQSRSLKLNGKYVIQEGKYEGELGVPICDADEFFTTLEELYHRYKYSVPSERSESKSRHYFKALPERELSDDSMLYGERRDKAQIELELHLLCQSINGLKWDSDKMGKWFWQSRVDKDLVILRSWVEPESK